MTKIIIGEDCGNSPKNIFIQKFTIAFAQMDTKFLVGNVTDDIQWNIVGDRLIRGKDDFAGALLGMKSAKEITILHIATHGKSGAADGNLKFISGRTFGFCDVYEYNNAKGDKIKAITSYVIEIKK
jgi:hypothetical protein